MWAELAPIARPDSIGRYMIKLFLVGRYFAERQHLQTQMFCCEAKIYKTFEDIDAQLSLVERSVVYDSVHNRL